jgi:hypothetical protein
MVMAMLETESAADYDRAHEQASNWARAMIG